MFSSGPRRYLVRTAVVVAVGAFVLGALPWPSDAASGDKTLKHVSGETGFSATENGSETAVTGTQDLPDTAYVVTRNGGVADIVLRDSSVIRIAQNAKIKVMEFNTAESGKENFIVCYNGAYRFHIERPAGGRSNYRFVTPTSQIAVRGTDGIVVIDPDNTTRVSTTIASSRDDVRLAANAAGTNLVLYMPPMQSPGSERLAVRAYDQDELAPLSPVDQLMQQSAPMQLAQVPFPVIFTVVGPGTTGIVTVAGTISVVNGVITLSVLSGTLSTVTAIGTTTAGVGAAGAAGAAVGAGTLTAAGAAAVAAAAAAAVAQSKASDQPSASPEPTVTVSPTPVPTQVPTPTASPTVNPTASPTPVKTPSPTPSPTGTASPTPSASPTLLPTATPAATASVDIHITGKGRGATGSGPLIRRPGAQLP